jgi:cell division protein FtsB
MTESDGARSSLRELPARVRAARVARRDRRALEFARRDRGEPGPSPTEPESGDARPTAPRPGRRNAAMIGAGVASVLLILLLFLGPGSINVWLGQRDQTRQLDAKISTIDRANDALAARAKQLEDPQAIIELARRDYGMVPKGSKAYAILPTPVPDDRPSGTWPFVELRSTGSASPPTTQRPSDSTP